MELVLTPGVVPMVVQHYTLDGACAHTWCGTNGCTTLYTGWSLCSHLVWYQWLYNTVHWMELVLTPGMVPMVVQHCTLDGACAHIWCGTNGCPTLYTGWSLCSHQVWYQWLYNTVHWMELVLTPGMVPMVVQHCTLDGACAHIWCGTNGCTTLYTEWSLCSHLVWYQWLYNTVHWMALVLTPGVVPMVVQHCTLNGACAHTWCGTNGCSTLYTGWSLCSHLVWYQWLYNTVHWMALVLTPGVVSMVVQHCTLNGACAHTWCGKHQTAVDRFLDIYIDPSMSVRCCLCRGMLAAADVCCHGCTVWC